VWDNASADCGVWHPDVVRIVPGLGIAVKAHRTEPPDVDFGNLQSAELWSRLLILLCPWIPKVPKDFMKQVNSGMKMRRYQSCHLEKLWHTCDATCGPYL
jgi:hypothetical protein